MQESAPAAGFRRAGGLWGVPLLVDLRGAGGGLAVNTALLTVAAWLWTKDGDPFLWLGGGLGAALLLQLSALAHEYAHALTARLLGERVDHVAFTLYGGCALVNLEAASRGRAAAIVAAGPLLSLALTLGFWAAATAVPFLAVAAAMNGLLLLLNVTPLGPLDGGRLLALARGTPNRIRTGDLHLERVAS